MSFPAFRASSVRRFSPWRAIAPVIALLLLASCSSDDDDPPPTPVAPPLASTPGGFVKLTPTATTIDGRSVQATCSKAPGTNAEFHFWARRGSVDKLVVFFEGGGACWDSGTCSLPIHAGTAPGQPALFKAEILPTDNPTTYGGMFDLNDARNPVKDWSIVYIPYCTGDIHGGSKTTAYTNPFNGQAYSIEHRGHDNFRVVLRWMQDNFAEPQQLLVTGSSAGGYGAVLNFPWVRDAFPKGSAVMLADASQGVTPASFDALRNANWNIQLSDAVYGANPQSTPTSALVRGLSGKFGGDRMAQYTTGLDLVQMQFYDVMVNGLAGVQGTACQAWADQMVAGLQHNQIAPNFRSYLAAGTTHTLMRGPLYFSETSAGTSFLGWMGALLSAGGVSNASCTNCTTFPTACPL
jgi:hypothetical protein